MSKYLSEECWQCDEYINPYGCTNHYCPIYQAWEDYQADQAYDRKIDRELEEE